MRHILAGIVVALMAWTAGAQETEVYIQQDVSAKTVTEAKVGEVLMRRGAVETVKASETTLNSKVYASPQWDQAGKPLVQYDADTGKIEAKSRYVRFVPDEATGKLTVDKEVSNTGVKEFYTVPDNKTTRLSWTVDTDAETVTWDNAGKRLIFYGFGGLYMFESPPPVAWDADKKPVGVTVAYDKGVLTYGILEGEYRYPVTVDPTTIIVSNDGKVVSTNATYATARNAAAGSSASAQEINIGQLAGFNVLRSFISFAIPDLGTATAISLFLKGESDHSTTDFDMYVLTSTYSNPLVKEDFDLLDGWGTGTFTGAVLNNTWNTSSYAGNENWNELTFNAAGISATVAKKSDTLKLALISKEDYDKSEPTNDEYINFYGSYYAGKKPYLSITQSIGSPPTRYRFQNDPIPIFKNDPIPIWRR